MQVIQILIIFKTYLLRIESQRIGATIIVEQHVEVLNMSPPKSDRVVSTTKHSSLNN